MKKIHKVLLVLCGIMTIGLGGCSKVTDEELMKIYINDQDSNKVYIKNASSGDEEVLVDIPTINICVIEEDVYYIPGDFEAIYKINTKTLKKEEAASLEVMEPLNNSIQITAEHIKDNIVYKLIQLKEVGDDTITPDREYELNLKNNELKKIK